MKGEKHGLLLVGHGTRQQPGLAEFDQLAHQVQGLTKDWLVEPCFLELAQPDIPTAIGRLLSRGITRLTVAPALLFAAGHARRDIPAAVHAAIQGVPDLDVRQTHALEIHPRLLDLSAQRFQEALADAAPLDPQQTLLLLVARGSSEAPAVEKMHEFARARAARTPLGAVEACFAAVAEPSLDEALQRAVATHFNRIVVQPHLLFSGRVLDQINAVVAEIARRAPDRQWIVTTHLGPSPLVAEAIMSLVEQAN